MRTVYLASAALFAACWAPLAAHCEDRRATHYSIYSRDVGWDSLDMRVTEVGRQGQVVMFNISNYAGRNAAGSRFAMCAMAQFAMLNGFSHWSVADDAKKSDSTAQLVRVGFFVDALQEPAELFDTAFHQDMYPSAALIAPMCHFFDPYTGEMPGD